METTIQEIRCDELLRRPIHAVDGEIGSLSDIFFDDQTWVIRYLVVKTGGWLSGRKVLLLPNSVDRSAYPAESVPVTLTREEIRNSPDVNTDRPVSRQRELELGMYYGVSPIGLAVLPGGANGSGVLPVPVAPDVEDNDFDPHLRSVREVRKYALQSSDGRDVQIEDLTIDWKVLRLTSVLAKVEGEKAVLLPLDAVRTIRWEDQRISLNWSFSDVEGAPASLL